VDVLKQLTGANLDTIKNYWFTHGTVCGLPERLIARTGYTGEDGFEIYVPSDVATSEQIWDAVMDAGKTFGILPCGLGARNTLRLEAKMALYGHEISETINVFEAGLDRYCKMDKGEFIGRIALAKAYAAPQTRTLVGLEMIDRGIARDEYKVFDAAGEAVGVVTSGSLRRHFAKTSRWRMFLRRWRRRAQPFVEVRTQRVKAQVVATPFYKRAKKAAPQATATN
jgi:aminomethyltransferase